MAEDDFTILTAFIIFGALSLAVTVTAQIAISYFQAYQDAPMELISFLEAVNFSIQENESYGDDTAKVQQLGDKLRLNKLLREIQKGSDELREALNACIAEGTSKLKISVRLLWKAKKKGLEQRVHRLDMLRLRFLVVYMGIIAARTSQLRNPTIPYTPPLSPVGDSEKGISSVAKRPGLSHDLTEAITGRGDHGISPPRRFSTQAIGHNDRVSGGQKLGWASVIQELQKSPKMHKRHASTETSTSKFRH